MVRHAVYFVPADDSPLGAAGAALFGRWPDGRRATQAIGSDENRDCERVVGPARYGFHATLLAPFELVQRVNEAVLVDAVAAVAERHRPIELTGLAVARLNGHVALMSGERSSATAVRAIDALAADCVKSLDRFRERLDPAELARRAAGLPVGLSGERERALLERWGYPWVLDAFRFHMTLSAPLQQTGGDSDADALERWIVRLEQHFSAALGARQELDQLAVCRQADRAAPFLRIAQCPLGRACASRTPCVG